MWIPLPTAVGFWWRRDSASDRKPVIVNIREDHMGLYDRDTSGLTLEAIGGEYQKVADPVYEAPNG